MTALIAIVWLVSTIVAALIWRHRGGSAIVGAGFGALFGIVGVVISMLAKPGDSLRSSPRTRA